MSLYNFAWTGMYSRDWELACEFWIATRIKTRFIVHSDDDAILCAQTLTRSLGLLPVPTHGLVLGWDLWDGFDNCFILVARRGRLLRFALVRRAPAAVAARRRDAGRGLARDG